MVQPGRISAGIVQVPHKNPILLLVAKPETNPSQILATKPDADISIWVILSKLPANIHSSTHLIPISKITTVLLISNHLLTEIWRTTGSLPSASCQPTATLLMSGTTVRLVDKVVVVVDEEVDEEEGEGGLGTG